MSQFILIQLRHVIEQKSPLLFIVLIRIVRHGAVILSETNQPCPVSIVPVGYIKVSLVQFGDSFEIIFYRIIQNDPFGPRPGKRHGLNLVRVRMNHNITNIVLRILGDDFDLAAFDIQHYQAPCVGVSRID